ncbi:hypothetical protein D3C81_1253620 [compost metagenome]
MGQRQRILQLIAEAKGTAGLIVTAACLNAAGEGLVQQPAVGQQVDGRLWRGYLHLVENSVPMYRDLLQFILQAVFPQVFLQQRFGLIGVLSKAQSEDKAALIAIDQADGRLGRTARIHARAGLAGQPPQLQHRRAGKRSVAANEFTPIATDRTVRTGHAEESRSFRTTAAVMVGGQDAAAAIERSLLGDDVHSRFLPQIAEDKFHVAGGRQLAGTPGGIGQRQQEQFYRRFFGHQHGELAVDAAFAVIEHAIAETVTGQIVTTAAGRQRCR